MARLLNFGINAAPEFSPVSYSVWKGLSIM